MTIALETRGLEKQFGGLKVTRDLSLKIEAGARHALIGPNGAGKTTVINLLTGVLKPNGGRILLLGNDITDLPRAYAGAARAVAHLSDQSALCRSDAAGDHRACGIGTSGPRRRLVAPDGFARGRQRGDRRYSRALPSARGDERADREICLMASSACWK